MNYHDPHYWNLFIRELADAASSLEQSEIIWYRGLPDVRFELLPSLLRIKDGVAKEKILFETYSQWSPQMREIHERDTSDDWDTLYNMQHFGIPTRLLDWTEVFGVAVFFAMLGRDDVDSAVFVLDPLGLNTKIGRAGLLKEAEFSYRAVYWESKPFSPQTPIALSPRHHNYRLAAQRGRFTAHGTDIRPLEEIAPTCVRKVILRKDAKAAARQFLDLAGINAYSTFPDVTGVAPFVRSIVGL